MLGGLDEIGNVDQRKALRRAILEDGIKAYSTCIWMLTSRIVGYEDVPFESLGVKGLPVYFKTTDIDEYSEKILQRQISEIHDLFYLLPFTIDQIAQFADRWYSLREADKATREERTKDLIKVISDSPDIQKLARNPNLLTMIALIHRIHATLPSGRARLYDKITEVYLESIDKYRGLLNKETAVPMNTHRLWLAALGDEIQERRGRTDASEILLSKDEVKTKMIEFLNGKKYDLEKELSYIARRSGLLLPRKPGYFNFVHLSFQEYFASVYLYEGIIFDQEEFFKKIIELRDKSVWRECLIFFFEKLEPHRGMPDKLFDQLFSDSSPKTSETVHLAAALLGDLHNGLSSSRREKASEIILMRFNQPNEDYDDKLQDAVNALPQEIWSDHFLPCIEKFLQHLAAGHSPIVPDLLIFLQNLERLELKQAEDLLAQTVLKQIKAEDLRFLSPFSYAGDGRARKEMLSRMPIQMWFSEFYYIVEMPVYTLADRTIPWDIQVKNKDDFLAWGGVSLLNDDRENNIFRK